MDAVAKPGLRNIGPVGCFGKEGLKKEFCGPNERACAFNGLRIFPAAAKEFGRVFFGGDVGARTRC